MYFFKDIEGNWIIGYTPDNIISKEPSRLLIHTNTNISVVTVGEGTVLIPPMEITDIKKNAAGDFYATLAEFKSAVSSFFDNDSSSDIVEKIDDLMGVVSNSGAATLKTIAVELTRPANQTPYTAGDVIGDVSGALVPILNVAKAAGLGVRITRIRIQTNDTSVAGTKFNVHVYCQAPAAIADNAPFVIDYANAVKRVGAIPVVMGVGNLGTVGMNDYNIMTCNPLTRDLYFILETVTGFTSSAASTKFTLAFDLELSNS